MSRLPVLFAVPGRDALTCRRVAWPATLVGVLALVALPPTAADVFHLTNGGSVEGQLLETAGEFHKIRTTVGIVALPTAAVERIERKPSPLEEYDTRVQETAETAEAHTALAAWCEEQGLAAERRRHLLRALELNPEYAPARRALGYVRVGDFWVDGRRTHAAERDDEPQDTTGETEGERLARAIQGQWALRINAIRRQLLDNPSARLVQEGQRRILAIRDPLAILPLSRELGAGGFSTRALLIEALSSFDEDEATMNLAVLGLLDPARELRAAALVELKRRQDARVTGQYREALRTGSDALVARAAEALGRLEARDAIPDLIDALTVQREKWVELPVRKYFGYWPVVFSRASVCGIGLGACASRPRLGVIGGWDYVHGNWRPRIGLLREWDTIYYAPEYAQELRPVTVYRTQVLEALKSITGQNFGFEADEWRRWWATAAS